MQQQLANLIMYVMLIKVGDSPALACWVPFKLCQKNAFLIHEAVGEVLAGFCLLHALCSVLLVV